MSSPTSCWVARPRPQFPALRSRGYRWPRAELRMILGVGIDIVDTERWARSLDRIQHEIFTPRELAACADRVDRVEALAARFAAKEARGQRLDPVNPIGARRQFPRGEDLVLNAVERARPTFRVDDVDPHAENHAQLSARPTVSAAA